MVLVNVYLNDEENKIVEDRQEREQITSKMATIKHIIRESVEKEEDEGGDVDE